MCGQPATLLVSQLVCCSMETCAQPQDHRRPPPPGPHVYSICYTIHRDRTQRETIVHVHGSSMLRGVSRLLATVNLQGQIVVQPSQCMACPRWRVCMHPCLVRRQSANMAVLRGAVSHAGSDDVSSVHCPMLAAFGGGWYHTGKASALLLSREAAVGVEISLVTVRDGKHEWSYHVRITRSEASVSRRRCPRSGSSREATGPTRAASQHASCICAIISPETRTARQNVSRRSKADTDGEYPTQEHHLQVWQHLWRCVLVCRRRGILPRNNL